MLSWLDGSWFQGCTLSFAGHSAYGQRCYSFKVGSHRQLPAAAAAGGMNAQVEPDYCSGLLGAFHEGNQALLMCGNNLPDKPAIVWVVLANESLHAMQ